MIDALQALNMYRTTLDSRGVPGSYRYRVYVRAHGDVPIARVELWGGGQCLRRYRPNQEEVLLAIEELHDRQRELFVRVVDTKGREAIGTSIMVHDKTMVFGWCGDHCNVLPGGTGLDREGNPAAFAGLSHPKSILEVAGGPGTSITEMGMYVPYGTDTSAPPLGIPGMVSLAGADGVLPALQLCRGEVRFKRPVTLAATETVNLVLGQGGDGVVRHGLYTAQGQVAQSGKLAGALGKGNFLT